MIFMIPSHPSATATVVNEDLLKYRRLATFYWRDLQEYLYGSESIQFKDEIFKKLIDDDAFARDWRTLTVEGSREISNRRWKRLLEYNFIKLNGFRTDPERFVDFSDVLECYDQSLAAKFYINAFFYITVLSLGSDQHNQILKKCANNEIVGCFCLTELSHGSDASSIRTHCRYDNGEFVMHTPDDEAMKCWAGNLSRSATHAIVFAQLYTNGCCHGLHAFCMQIRDPKTMSPLPGITIGDMGEKLGDWNAVENGWIKFDNHRFELDALLDKIGNVKSDGTYKSTFKSKKEQQYSVLSSLSIGRAAIIGKGTVATRLAAVIATRFSAVRKQFRTNSGEELSVIEYPMQQHRVFPHIAAAVALTIFYRKFISFCYRHFICCAENQMDSNQLLLSREINVLSCAVKITSTEAGINALDEARLACGGYGFLKCSRLNDLLVSFDPARTYEGDNNILLQQVTSALLSIANDDSSELKDSAIGSFEFLHSTPVKFSSWKDDTLEDIVEAYIWLLHSLLATIRADIESKRNSGLTAAEARVAAQSQCFRMLAIAYSELTILRWFRESIEAASNSIREVLHRLAEVYIYNSMEKHIATLYITGYCNGEQWGSTVRQRLREAEAALLCDAVSVCDALAPPDFVLHSLLGNSDGQVYNRLIRNFMELSPN